MDHGILCSVRGLGVTGLTVCGKTLFEILEQRGLAVLLVTKPLDSHRLTPCAAAHLMPSASPLRCPKVHPVRYALGEDAFLKDE